MKAALLCASVALVLAAGCSAPVDASAPEEAAGAALERELDPAPAPADGDATDVPAADEEGPAEGASPAEPPNDVLRPPPPPRPLLADLSIERDRVHVTAAGFAGLVAEGKLVEASCNAAQVKVVYPYRNVGLATAPSHRNRVYFSSGPAGFWQSMEIKKGHGAMAVTSIFLAALAPNVEHTVTIQVDSSAAVTESNEANNLFKFRFKRVCPTTP